MVGRELGDQLDLGERTLGNTALKVCHDQSFGQVQDVSLRSERAEIFGISGLIGAGRTELLRLIMALT